MTVTVDLTPDQVTQLNKLASATGRGTDQLMQEAVENLLSYNKWFEEQVQIGQAQIQRGDLLEDEEVRARIDRMFRP
jgi:predicted transcriptional regulator